MLNKTFGRVSLICLIGLAIVTSLFGANPYGPTSTKSISALPILFLSNLPFSPRVIESTIGITIYMVQAPLASLKAKALGDLPIIKIGLGD